MEAKTTSSAVEEASRLGDESRLALRDLILTLADNKRLLGLRYSDWMLGAPTLETGIAASSMAQDEWGHGRLTYALLGEFGEDPKSLEHERGAEAYHNMEALDSRFTSWAEMIAASLLLDTALTVQFGALLHSSYPAVHNRVQKLLDEEVFHFQYACGWVEKLGTAPGVRDELVAAMSRLLPMALRWLSRPDDPSMRRLQAEDLVREGPDALRLRYLSRIGPVLQRAGIAEDLGLSPVAAGWDYSGELDWTGWDDRRRRASAGGPDPDTLARARGDKNRAMLLD